MYVIMHLFSLFIIQVLTVCLAFDIKLEGVTQMGDYMRPIKAVKENQIREFPVKHIENPEKETKKFIFHRAKDILPTRTEELVDYVHHIKKKADKTLNSLGKYIETEMDREGDLTHLIRNAIEDFETKLVNYLNIVYSEKPEYKIDEEFVFLDIAETANKLLYREGRRLLNDIVLEINDTSKTANLKMYKELYKDSLTSKKEEMTYICSNFKVCRNYPSFTDYSADFISEILKLPDGKFEIVVDIFKNFIKTNSLFFETIIRNEDREIILQEIVNFLQDSYSIREFLSVLRAVMTQRFKIVHNSNTILKARTKAVRILLDMIDTALFKEDEDILYIDFSNTVHGMRSWVGRKRDDINDFLRKFLDSIIMKLNFAFTNNTRAEVKALVEVILRGKTENDVYIYMNKFGSKFVRGEDRSISNELGMF